MNAALPVRPCTPARPPTKVLESKQTPVSVGKIEQHLCSRFPLLNGLRVGLLAISTPSMLSSHIGKGHQKIVLLRIAIWGTGSRKKQSSNQQ
jgi:hypothetical protein